MITLTKSKEGIEFYPKLDYVLSTLRDGTYTVTVKRKAESRSISQNALMWMWFACIARETGMTEQDVHDTYCALFLSRAAATPRGDVIRVTSGTSRLTKPEFTTFLERVQADAAEMGIILPLPEDQYFEDFYNEFKPR